MNNLPKVIAVFIIIVIIAIIAFWGVIAFVAIHFLSKIW